MIKPSDTDPVEESKGYVGKYDPGKPLLISYKGLRIVQPLTKDVRERPNSSNSVAIETKRDLDGLCEPPND